MLVNMKGKPTWMKSVLFTEKVIKKDISGMDNKLSM